MNLQDVLPLVVPIVRAAGQKILQVYREKGAFSIEIKADNSPLTKADVASHKTLVSGLEQLVPAFPVLSEESEQIPYSERRARHQYWLIDPLDGTKEFIHRQDDFSINVALIQGAEAVMGVVYAPVFDVLYTAIRGGGAYKQVQGKTPERITTAACNPQHLRVTVSRRHTAEKLNHWLAGFPGFEVIPRGSAIKICLVAEGAADLYPRFGKTSEWDTAAGQCVLEEAGGALYSVADQQPVQYNIKESLLNPEFLAVGDKSVDWFKVFSSLYNGDPTNR